MLSSSKATLPNYVQDQQGRTVAARWKAVVYYLEGPQCYSVFLSEPSDHWESEFHVDQEYVDWDTTAGELPHVR
jgi:hypothetical protein